MTIEIICYKIIIHFYTFLDNYRTLSHTYCRQGFSKCLKQLPQVAPWKIFSPHSTPVKLTRWHKMEDVFGIHVLQVLLGQVLSKSQSAIIFSAPTTPCIYNWSPLNISHTHTGTLQLLQQHVTGGRAGREGTEGGCLFLLGPCAIE